MGLQGYGVEVAAGEGVVAVGAAGVEEVEGGQAVAGTFDEELVALGAVGVFVSEAGEVADVDVVEAGFGADLVGIEEGLGLGWLEVVALEVGVEAADVPGDVGA